MNQISDGIRAQAIPAAPGPWRTFNAGMICDANGQLVASCHNIQGMGHRTAFDVFANAALIAAAPALKENAQHNLEFLLELQRSGFMENSPLQQRIDATRAAITKTAGGV